MLGVNKSLNWICNGFELVRRYVRRRRKWVDFRKLLVFV